ncbi:MAG: hypothetical protein KDK25_02950 [Leptospiraceae bacterium]|nr:hypothetical protein [Leptospiraceae bacterium]
MSYSRPEIQTALVVGATGEAGLSALEAIREANPKAHIIATTRSQQSVPGADETLPDMEINDELSDRIRSELKQQASRLDLLVYTPALGEPGFPIERTTEEQWSQAADFSFQPILELERNLKPALSIGYSAFYWLPHTLSFYGALGYVKKAMEEWALEAPERRALVRGGTFYSKSVRGISLLLQRLMKKSDNPELQKMKEEFAGTDMRFLDFFLEYAARHEKEAFSQNFEEPYRRTERDDLRRGLVKILAGDGPIVNVVGPWTWSDASLPALPGYFERFGYGSP